MKQITKEAIIKELQKLQKTWQKEKKEGIITRWYFRQKSKIANAAVERLFGSFTEAKKEAKLEGEKKEKITRDSFDIHKINNKKNKRYFVSSIIPNAPVNEIFWSCILNYCKENNAEPLLLVMRGVNVKDEFSQEVLDRFKNYFVTEFEFNKNLICRDFLIDPAQIIPLTGLARYGGRKQSLLVASPKQSLVTIPKQINEFPHIVFSSGTICEPKYKNNRQGQIAKEDNCLSGWIIEVKDESMFFIRPIAFDSHGFQDLSKYYCMDKIESKNANSIVIEPHFPLVKENMKTFIDEIINEYKPSNMLLHDSFDAGSVNPHNLNKAWVKCKDESLQETLFLELESLGRNLLELENKYKTINFLHVYSNHNQFLTRYLENGDFVKDYINIKLSAELFLAMVNDEDPIEYYLKKNFSELKRQTFLKIGESYKINDVEMNAHGHAGSNGSKGSVKGIEASINNAVIGHSHVYSIYRDVVSIPCITNLQQQYNKDGTSGWLQGCTLLFENGKKQTILNIYDEWKL